MTFGVLASAWAVVAKRILVEVTVLDEVVVDRDDVADTQTHQLLDDWTAGARPTTPIRNRLSRRVVPSPNAWS